MNETKTQFVRPHVDVFESAAEYLIVAEVPGVTTDTLEVKFHDGELTLQGKRKPVEGRTPLAEEYREVDFARAFSLPDGVDGERIEAKLEKGVLEVHVPKQAQKQARRIAVQAS